MADFLAKYPVAITLQEVPENPNMEGSVDNMINYYVTLTYDKRVMSVYFSTGLGWVEKVSLTKKGHPGISAPMVSYDKKRKRFVDGRKCEVDKPQFYRIKKPAVVDVLDCLASDASNIDQSFDDWADDLGYETDSRKAEATYHACQKSARDLRHLLGYSAFSELLATERM